ncbi:MAG TPA: DnaB-like helicase C-terminal domain-containing protein [Gemmatimonadaceae bacterium]|nr:DnaB-like helicase C-terminal domain-containing protein [Gemmatimonadaceae bacterium]
MERTDYRSLIIGGLNSSGRKVKMNGDKGQFRCPRHDDKTPSAWIGDYRWGCSSCGFDEPLDTLGDLLGIPKPKKGYTLEDYADQKGFAVADLRRWGLSTRVGKYGADEVVIPYRDADGNLLREKIRTAKKSFWGEGTGTYPYGLDVLRKADPTEPVIFCEGESDCHAAWSKGILAQGVPGAGGWKRDWAGNYTGRDIYVWKEPDTASEKLVASITASFPAAKVIDSKTAGVKDIADLFRTEGKNFKQRLRELMQSASAQTVATEPAAASSQPAAPRPPVARFIELAGDRMEELLAVKQKPVDAVPTPFPKWNTHCRDEGGGMGLARGWHVTVAGKTGQGKSVFALNCSRSGVERGEVVSFVSLEMSWVQLATRYMAIVSGERIYRLEQGSALDPAIHRRAAHALASIRERTGGQLLCNERHISNLDDIRAAIRYQHEYLGSRYVIVDYMQLAKVVGVRDILEAVTIISGSVREEGRELQIITLGLSQLNRETSKDRENPPTPQGLMGGSPLENDSDQVMLLDHTRFERSRVSNSAKQHFILGKNRHGATGEIEARWDYNTLRVEEIPSAPAEPEERSEIFSEDEEEAEAQAALSFPGGGTRAA